MSTAGVLEKITEIAHRVVASEGMEVVEIEWKGGGQNRVLRIYIDKPGGVTHADCETISNQVGTILDVEDVIPGSSYRLEVSSPGLDRKLLKPSDYQRFLGRKAKVILHRPIDGRNYFVGRLAGFEDGQVNLEADDVGAVHFSLDDIKSARLVVDWRG